MLDVKFYKTNSPKNKLVKSLTSIGTFSCALKDNTSVLNPVLIISTNENLYNSNYIEITTFNRKYFITDIKSIGNNRWEVSAHVDVLNTYASEIKSNSAVIRRQENVYNLYLNDPDFLTYNYDRIQTKKFTPVSGFHKQLTYRLIINGS